MTKVLIIDDDVNVTDMLKLTLEPLGFEVQPVNTSSEGVEMARQWDPDVVIVDLVMPLKDGGAVCEEIRQFSQVPILVLSVINQPNVVANTLDKGADDFLIKPVPTGILVAHLNKLTRRTRNGRNANQTNFSIW